MSMGWIHPWIGSDWIGLGPMTVMYKILTAYVFQRNTPRLFYVITSDFLHTYGGRGVSDLQDTACIRWHSSSTVLARTVQRLPDTIDTVARREFAISAQAERDFLSVGRTITDARSQLSASTVENKH